MHKRTVLMYFFFLMFINTLYAQDYHKVDSIVREAFPSYSHPDKLATEINKQFQTEEEKARAIYTWIALHIKYDLSALYKKTKSITFSYRTIEEKEKKEKMIFYRSVVQSMNKKKGVCEDYANLFKYLCDKTGIESEIIHGTAKTFPQEIGKLPNNSNHAWNAVRIGTEWKLVDVTWGAGYVNENNTYIHDFTDAYFFLSPEKFAYNHYPEDSKWLLTPLSPDEFANFPLYYRSYFTSFLEVIEPIDGIIELSGQKNIIIKIKNPKNHTLMFAYNNETYAYPITPQMDGQIYTYELTLPKKPAQYLSISLNLQTFVVFKLSR